MGIKTERFGYGTCGEESAENRYVFDFDLCSVKKGWAQLIRPRMQLLRNLGSSKAVQNVSFAEGDTCIKPLTPPRNSRP